MQQRPSPGKQFPSSSSKKLDLRPFRSEPRAQKKRPKSYQLLTDPRATFQEIPHRNAYKKCA